MSTDSATAEFKDAPPEGFQPYRAISKAAIVSLILTLLSLPLVFFYDLVPALPGMLLLPLLGFIFGLASRANIKRYPQELTGKPVATFGIAIGVLLFFGGVSYSAYDYITELPEGYERISFDILQPDSKKLPVPKTALDLNGKKVFIKGYLYPDGQSKNIKRFVLIPDLGTCCFGGQPKLTNMIEVTLKDPNRVYYSQRRRKLGGFLKVDTRLKPITGLQGVYYQMDADHVR